MQIQLVSFICGAKVRTKTAPRHSKTIKAESFLFGIVLGGLIVIFADY